MPKKKKLGPKPSTVAKMVTDATKEFDGIGELNKPENTKREPRQPHVPTKANKMFVQCAKIAGWSQADIARMLNVDPATVSRKYKKELGVAKMTVTTTAIEQLVKLIKKGHFQAIKLYLERQAGWVETKINEHRDGDPKGYTDDQLRQALAELDRERDEIVLDAETEGDGKPTIQ